jgi:hypothetical protein
VRAALLEKTLRLLQVLFQLIKQCSLLCLACFCWNEVVALL